MGRKEIGHKSSPDNHIAALPACSISLWYTALTFRNVEH
jgi:hypothetical protein